MDIQSLVEGAEKPRLNTLFVTWTKTIVTVTRPCATFYAKGKTEVLSSFILCFLCGRVVQTTFGESEGKQGKGIFPASLILSTDLHSMGQWMQEGERTVFGNIPGDLRSPIMT